MAEDINCIVVPVHYRPNVVTCEFACIGVILKSPESGNAAFRLADSDESVISRIAAFFPERNRDEILQAMSWARHDIEFALSSDRRTGGRAAFENLIRPRENVVRYGTPQSVLTQDLARELDDQYVLQVRRGIG